MSSPRFAGGSADRRGLSRPHSSHKDRSRSRSRDGRRERSRSRDNRLTPRYNNRDLKRFERDSPPPSRGTMRRESSAGSSNDNRPRYKESLNTPSVSTPSSAHVDRIVTRCTLEPGEIIDDDKTQKEVAVIIQRDWLSELEESVARQAKIIEASSESLPTDLQGLCNAILIFDV